MHSPLPARGVLHCDIKPANVLVTRYGRPMLADFNVSFDRARHPTPVGGTLPYMAPEHYLAMFRQPGGRVDERSDVFSLGIVLHELATGELPSRGRQPLDECRANLRPSSAVASNRMRPSAINRPANWPRPGGCVTTHRRGRLCPRRSAGSAHDAHPVTALALAAVVPHLAASLVNIAYNGVQIKFTPEQRARSSLAGRGL